MSLHTQLADARARRAHLIDRISMDDPEAKCAACRARGMMLAAVVLVTAAWIITARRKAHR